MVDMFFYRDPEEIEKENEAAEFGENDLSAAADATAGEWGVEVETDGVAGIAAAADWSAQTATADWADDVEAPANASWDA
jgi:small subunit ribosomal protein SAe